MRTTGLVPLWFLWDGACVWLATRATHPTGRNLGDGRRTRRPLAVQARHEQRELPRRHLMSDGTWPA
ncbi:hypothetical protein [Streptomyces sp. NPDC090083]|uniref:hypothetical protein n=1 Tax=Streptomyces sp. NPDC090083 TaxID=3365941 RepID=UPI00382D15CB